jgi:hypothetical protein
VTPGKEHQSYSGEESLDVFVVLSPTVLSSVSLQASIFLCSGFFVMIGSLTLITLDWINNASQAANGH